MAPTRTNYIGPTWIKSGDTYIEVIGSDVIIGSISSKKVKVLNYEDQEDAQKVLNAIKTLFCFEKIDG